MKNIVRRNFINYLLGYLILVLIILIVNFLSLIRQNFSLIIIIVPMVTIIIFQYFKRLKRILCKNNIMLNFSILNALVAIGY